ncbi:uncharacterized protein [Euphorbia lathyris]|uniref:uncharacterized protein isoform X1 n=1 Tax=Euphorbia lathyris TaxID=212925 RepID=UPI00331327A8
MIQKLIQEASLHYLNHLTSAIQRWKGKGLSGHSRTILYVVDDLVREICPCYRFGKNMRRAGFGACFLQGTVYFIIALTALLNYITFMVTRPPCFLYIAIGFTISTGMYLGFFRTQIRKKFNIRLAGELFKGGGET